MSGTFEGRDYDEMFEPIDLMDKDGANNPMGALHFIVVANAYMGIPNATQRKRIADTIQGFKAKRYWFALVTDSMLARGAMTAISWIQTPKPGTVNTAHATFDQAARWAEAQRGTSYKEIHDLYHRAHWMGVRSGQQPL
jgi:hypothetical protein